jgi:phosphoribosylamine--glycine ligase
MRVLVVGGGGREHALCWKLAQNPTVERLYAAPGNAGMAELATLVPVSAGDVTGVVEFAERESINLTVVGPEAPLVAGLVDEMQARGMAVFGPTRDAARLEGSKAWARRLCDTHGIPAPRSRTFDQMEPALAYLDELGEGPYVVKADGLAAGKGVTVAETRQEAEAALVDCLVHRIFGDAGLTVLIEEYMEGWEVSAMALTDGRSILPLALAHDYKRALDGDRGPNTGGMGAFSPLPRIGPEMEATIVDTVLTPTVRALEQEGVRYRGVLYAGIMMTAAGPKVLEFNCRFGDPETQVVLPRLQSSLGEALLACVEGNLAVYELAWTPDACAGVVVASAGYPGPVAAGKEVAGLDAAAAVDGVHLFHAGTSSREGRVVTAGGRVLTVSAVGADPAEARRRAYEACSLITFDGMTYRRDIADER